MVLVLHMRIVIVYFIFIGREGDQALLVTLADHVYAIGKNGNGCLGLGDTIQRNRETEVCALSGRHVKGIVDNPTK